MPVTETQLHWVGLGVGTLAWLVAARTLAPFVKPSRHADESGAIPLGMLAMASGVLAAALFEYVARPLFLTGEDIVHPTHKYCNQCKTCFCLCACSEHKH